MSFTQPLTQPEDAFVYAGRLIEVSDNPSTTAVECYLLACDLLIAELGKRRARRLFGQCYRLLEDA